MKTYECTICLHHNLVNRLHCSTCGTIPARYSITGTPSIQVGTVIDWNFYLPIVAAHGCDRIEQHHTSRMNLRTMPLDYYSS